MVGFFFFKQKTAYEIPKRDWSSDVCSSDPDTVIPGLSAVEATDPVKPPSPEAGEAVAEPDGGAPGEEPPEAAEVTEGEQVFADTVVAAATRAADEHAAAAPGDVGSAERAWFELPDPEHVAPGVERSEEHTSELQSRFAIAYA